MEEWSYCVISSNSPSAYKHAIWLKKRGGDGKEHSSGRKKSLSQMLCLNNFRSSSGRDHLLSAVRFITRVPLIECSSPKSCHHREILHICFRSTNTTFLLCRLFFFSSSSKVSCCFYHPLLYSVQFIIPLKLWLILQLVRCCFSMWFSSHV